MIENPETLASRDFTRFNGGNVGVKDHEIESVTRADQLAAEFLGRRERPGPSDIETFEIRFGRR